MAENGFIGRVTTKLERLKVREESLQEELDTVVQERSRYQAAIEIYRDEMGEGSEGAESLPGTASDRELEAMTIADAAHAVLKESGQPMRMRDIVRRLRRAGTTKAKGTGAYSSVLKTLDRRADFFIKTGKTWSLVEWKKQERAPTALFTEAN